MEISVKNVDSKPGSAVESDHKCNIAVMHIKIAKKKKERTQQTIKYRKPTEQQQELYNEEVQKRVNETDWNGIESPFEKWAEIILAAADATLSVVSPKQKQPYIS